MREKCAKLEEYIDKKWKKTAKQLKNNGKTLVHSLL